MRTVSVLLLVLVLVPFSPAAAQQSQPQQSQPQQSQLRQSQPPSAPGHVQPDMAGSGRTATAARLSVPIAGGGLPAAPWQLSAARPDELNEGRRYSVTGGVIGAVIGAVAGGALACLANRDDYGVYCAGQSDTKVVIGAVIGAGVGGWVGAVLMGRRD